MKGNLPGFFIAAHQMSGTLPAGLQDANQSIKEQGARPDQRTLATAYRRRECISVPACLDSSMALICSACRSVPTCNHHNTQLDADSSCTELKVTVAISHQQHALSRM